MAEQLADGSAAPPDPVIIKDGQGQSYTVDASEVDTFLRSGEGYTLAPNAEQASDYGRIPIQTPGGEKLFVDPAEAQQRIQSFEADAARTADVLQAEEEQRYGGALQGARAASLGILKNVPGAIPALTAIDPTLAPDLQNLERYRPGAETVGEVSGFAALTALTGGLTGAGNAGAAAATRLGTAAGLAEGGAALRALGAAGRGAMEFGLLEANREVNEAAIQQREYEAAKVASAFAGGALLGGVLLGGGSLALSGAKGVGSGVVKWGAEKLGTAERPLAERAIEYAEEKTLKSTGGTQKQIGKILDATPELRKAADDILIKEAPAALGKAEGAILSRAEMQSGIEATRDKIGAEMGTALKAIDANAHGIGADIGKIVSAAKETVLAPLEANVFAGAEASAVEKQIRNLESLKDYRIGFETLHELSSQLGAVIRRNPTAAHAADMKAFRSLLEDEIMAGATRVSEEIGGDIAGQYAKARTRYAAAKLLEDAVATGVKAETKNLTFSLSSMIAGGSGSSLGASIGGAVAGPVGAAVGGFLGGLGGAVAANLNKRFGDQVVSTALRAYANGNTAQLSTIVDRAVSTSVAGYLKAGATKAVPAMGQAAATGTRVAATNYARETELGRSLFGEPTAKKSQPKEPARVAFTPALKPSPRAEVSDAQAKRAVQVIQQSAQQQQAALERLAEQAPHLLPEIRGQLAASKRAHDYLLSKIPQSSNITATLTPKLEAPRMSKAQRDELLTAVRVVSDPLSVLDSLKAGKVTKAEVDALKATAPELYASVQQAVQAQLGARETPLPYREALDLSLLLGMVGHPSLDPAAARSIQAAFGPRPQTTSQQQPSAPKRTISMSKDWALRPEES